MMSLVLTIFIHWLTGFFILKILLPQDLDSPSIKCSLSLGIGLGVQALISFILTTIFPKTMHHIIFIQITVLLLMFFLSRFATPSSQREDNNKRFSQIETIQKYLSRTFNATHSPFTLFIMLWFIFLSFALITKAQQSPFGQWDGWALWNMKTRFLIFGAEDWRKLLTLHWHTQPDYPLMLPYIQLNLAKHSPLPLEITSIATSLIFALSTPGLLYAGLKRLIDKKLAFIACILLTSLPFYHYMATAQYADIVLAYYLLGSLIIWHQLIQKPNQHLCVLLSLLLGCLAFSKNEGFLMTVIIVTLSLFFLKPPWRRWIIFSTIFSCLPALGFKLFLAPENRDFTFSGLNTPFPFLNFEGGYLIVTALMRTLKNYSWGYIWGLILLILICHLRRIISCNSLQAILSFFAIYFFFLTLTYLTTIHFDLSWRLSRTLPRILFYLLPAILFFSFSLIKNVNKNRLT